MTVRIEITRDTATSALRDAVHSLDGSATQELLTRIGEYLQGAVQDRAKLQISPDGVPWSPLSPRYARRKQRKKPGVPILKFEGRMLEHQLTYQVTGRELAIGTMAKYGATHQLGDPERNIPARPWLFLDYGSGLSAEDAAEIVAIAHGLFTMRR
jgi:phage virion morphogenesis protein